MYVKKPIDVKALAHACPESIGGVQRGLCVGPRQTESLYLYRVPTAIPDEDTTHLQQRFSKVAQYLSDKLGIEVNYIPVKSYSASVAAFKKQRCTTGLVWRPLWFASAV